MVEVPVAEQHVQRRALDRARVGGTAHSSPEALERLARAVAPALHEPVRDHRGIHRAGAGAADRLDLHPSLLEEVIEDAPGECAVRATALQGEVDASWPGLGRNSFSNAARRLRPHLPVHCAVQPPSTGSAAPVIEAAASLARNTTSAPNSSGVTNCLLGCEARMTPRTTSSSLMPCAFAWSVIWPSTKGVRT